MSKNDDVTPDRMRAPTVDADGRRRWLYPFRGRGRLINIRKRLAMVLMLIYFCVPFITISGRPLIRLDVLDRQAYLFGLVFPFQEINFLVYILIFLMVALFFVTSLFGRLWCGYACPQTVFVEWLIRPIEEFIEGSAPQRQVRDKGPWNFDKVWRKGLKHTIYIMVVLLLSNALLAYFFEPATIKQWVVQPPWHNPLPFLFMSSVAILLYLDLTWFREQFCAFLCPYARFQAVMIDSHTPTIAYDPKRGEPRGKGKGGGDCIDCGLCTRVCPTGIDIRDGLQLECIQCGRCADACDQIQTNLKRPKGLIRTASQRQLEGKTRRGLRPRPIFYGLLLTLITCIAGIRLYNRGDLQITVTRLKGSTYTELPDGSYANYFNVRVRNNTSESLKLDLAKLSGEGSIICSFCDKEVEAFRSEKGSLVLTFPKSRNDLNVDLILNGQKFSVKLIRP